MRRSKMLMRATHSSIETGYTNEEKTVVDVRWKVGVD
jgi:hypothetical protein